MATFTDLPPEIRNLVYSEIPANNSLGLLITSRLIYQEAASHYYQQNHFTINLPLSYPSDCATILPPITDKFLRHLRRLTVCTSIGHQDSLSTQRAAHCITTLANIGATFSILNFELKSHKSRILQACTDDALLHSAHPITHALRTLLTSNVASRVHVELNHMWFATGVAQDLQQEFGDKLVISSISASGTLELQPTGISSLTHLSALSLDKQDIQDAEDRWSESPPSDWSGSMPLSLGSVLSELDTFSPMEFLDSDMDDLQRPAGSDTDLDALMFDFDTDDTEPEATSDGNALQSASDEALDETDDADDLELEHIADIEAVLASISEMQMQRVNKNDVCYMTNFAPELLGRWS